MIVLWNYDKYANFHTSTNIAAKATYKVSGLNAMLHYSVANTVVNVQDQLSKTVTIP